MSFPENFYIIKLSEILVFCIVYCQRFSSLHTFKIQQSIFVCEIICSNAGASSPFLFVALAPSFHQPFALSLSCPPATMGKSYFPIYKIKQVNFAEGTGVITGEG